MANARVGSHPSFGGTVVVNSTSSFTLDPSDSGKRFILKGAAVTVTLPTLSTKIAGFEITLISGDTNNHVLSGGASKIYGYAFNQSTTTAAAHCTALSGASSATLGSGAIGDIFQISSDGTNWYVQIMANAAVS